MYDRHAILVEGSVTYHEGINPEVHASNERMQSHPTSRKNTGRTLNLKKQVRISKVAGQLK